MRRHAWRTSEIVSGVRGLANEMSAVRRSGMANSSSSPSGGRLTIAQYNGEWPSIDFSWRRVESDREYPLHASAQLSRMLREAREFESCSRTRSRTSPSTVVRTSRVVRDALKLNHELLARPFPFRFDDDDGDLVKGGTIRDGEGTGDI